MLGQSAQQREKMAEHAIDREKARGVDVSAAEQCLTRGKDALKGGDEMQANRDFARLNCRWEFPSGLATPKFGKPVCRVLLAVRSIMEIRAKRSAIFAPPIARLA